MKIEDKPSKIRILIVEGSHDRLNGFSMLLEEAGYEVYRGGNMKSARSLSRKHHPDLVLLNWDMLDKNDSKTVPFIRDDLDLNRAFLVIVSEIDQVVIEEQEEASKLSADGYLTLPITNSEILDRVNTFVRILSLQRSLQQNIEEKQQIAKELRLENRRLRESQAVANVGSWETNLITLEVVWTEETFSIFETTPQKFKVTHQSFLQFVHPEDRQKVDDAFQASIGQKGPFEIEHRLLFDDGRIKFVEERWKTIFDSNGSPVRAVGTVQDITERRKILEELPTIQERFRLLSKATKDAIWDWDLVTDAIWWNEGMHDLFGYKTNEIEPDSRSWINRLHPDEKDAVVASVEQKINSIENNWSAEYRFRRSDGTYAHVLDRGCIVRNDAGKAVRMVGGMTDNTARKLETEALAMSETRARLAIQGAHMGSYEWNIKEDRIIWSRRHEELWGYAPGEFDGTYEAFERRIHSEDAPRVKDNIWNCMTAKEQFVVEFRVIWPDESLHWVVGIGEFTYGNDGKPDRMHGVVTEITERKNAVEALKSSEKEFRNLAEAMPQIVWISSADGQVVYVNQRWVDYTGKSFKESLGNEWTTSFHPMDQQRAWDAWQMSVSKGNSHSLECRLRRADGEYRWWLIRGKPQKDAEGNVIKWFGTCTDIHDLKLAELEVKRTNRALKMLSACNEALVHAVDEETLLRQICQIAIDVGGYHMAWVGYAQHDESRSILPLAWAGEEKGYLSEIKLSWSEDDLSGQGPAGRTIREEKIIFCEDIEANPSFYWIEAARQRNFKGIICLPLSNSRETFGLLALYSNQVRHFPAEEASLLQELADDIAFGIQTLRSRIEKSKLQQAVIAIASGVSASVGSAFFASLIRNTMEALNADAGLIAVLNTPDQSSARTITAIVHNQEIENFNYTLKDTPCERTRLGKTCVFEQKVQEQFPNDKLFAEFDTEAYAGTPLINSQGTVIGLMVVLFNKPIVGEEYIPSTLKIFAARAASELERQTSDQKIRQQAELLDAAHDAIVVTDLDDQVIYWNKGAENLFGWSSDEVIGQKTTSFLYENLAEVEHVYKKVQTHGNWEGELNKLNKHGKTIPVRISLTLVRDSDGQPSSMLAINSDLTEKKKLEAQFLRVQRMESIGTLAGGIAHDLNNVLAPIIMSVEVLKSMVQNEEGQDLLDTLMSSAQRGADLVKQVLAFARGVEGQRIPVNVKHLVRDLERVMRETFPKNLNIKVNLAPQIWTITGDPTQIHQVILNLCVNARDAMPDGGNLTISLQNTLVDDTYAAMNPGTKIGSYLIIEVEDSGCGMSSNVRERVFDPFFTTKELDKGTGLGLSTTLAIVKSHGGFIDLSSELGKGSKFKVFFPADATHEEPETFVEQTCLPRGNGELILVVDDEESIRNIARKTLEKFGYSVMLAKNGAEAVSIYDLRQKSISVVLTDMAMPVMDGAALIIALKSMNAKVCIIGSSGLASSGSYTGEDGGGIDHFLPKPYSAETLLRKIRAVLDSQ